jgi:hypothetical protein
VVIASSVSGCRSGHDEALVVQYDATIQPAGIRVRTDEQEEVTQATGMSSPGRALAKHRCGEAYDLVSFQSDYLGPRVQLNIGQCGDAVDDFDHDRRREQDAAVMIPLLSVALLRADTLATDRTAIRQRQ